jgi:hypothetical protein
MKSDLCGEMQTEAPESITKLEFIAILEKHYGSSKVEIKACLVRGTDMMPCVLSPCMENNSMTSMIWLGLCMEMKSFSRDWDTGRG